MFVWTDIETTGLDPQKDKILAVGMIITDDNFAEKGRAEWLVVPEKMPWMSLYVHDMHTKSGLLQRLDSPELDPDLHRISVVERHICDWLTLRLGQPDKDIKNRPVMAGNSVHFDRGFIGVQAPAILQHLNYRLLDVSTLKVLCMATIPGAKAWNDAQQSPSHTPLSDLEGSLRELAHWRLELSRN